MRRTSWTVRLAAPIAVLTALTGVAFAAAAVAAPDADSGTAGTAGTSATSTKTKTTKTTKVKTTKVKTTKVKGAVCKPGCTLATFDFETGSQGWVGADGMPLEVTADDAASGDQALALTRITGATGPALTITSRRMTRPASQRYLVSLAFRVGGPVSGKPVTLRVDGASQAVSESVVPTGDWQRLRATFVPTSPTVTLTVVEGPGDPCRGYPKVMQAVYVDDVSVGVPSSAVTITPAPTSTTCAPTPSPTGSWCTTCTVLTTDFEDATPQGWVAYRGSVVSTAREAAASGTYGLVALDVRSGYAPSLTIDTSVLDSRVNLTYEITAQVKLAPGEDASSLELAVTGASAATRYPATATDDGWATVRTRFVPGTALTDVMTFSLRREMVPCGSDAPVDVYVDDVRLWVPKDAPYPADTSAATSSASVSPQCTPPTTTPGPTTTTTTKPAFTCTAIDMPASDGVGSTVTIRQQGASLTDWTVNLTTGLLPVKVSPGTWSYANGVVTVTSEQGAGVLDSGQSLVLSLQGHNGSEILPYPVTLNGVSCSVAMP